MWKKALKAAADVHRTRHFLQEISRTNAAGTLKTATIEQAQIFVALFSGSVPMSELLVGHPEWIAEFLSPEALKYPRKEQGLRREVNAWLHAALELGNYEVAFAKLRQFRQREMLRIAARDLARLSNVAEITHEISNVADVCLSSVLQLCHAQLSRRLGEPFHRDASDCWQRTQFCVLGMGKLGGRELNYSSDVDVLFVYTEEGSVFKEPPTLKTDRSRGLANHIFFKRLAETFIAEVGRMTPDGMLFRIDLRLRPEGNAGPLARSLASYENYYAQWGQTWERMMLIKARGVAGSESLAGEFLELIQPFRYPRSLSEGVLQEIAAMKERIENEVVRAGELHRNVKLGRGGIREIEFVVQTLQILNAGRNPFLYEPQTLRALEKLAHYRLLTREEIKLLTLAYDFLRDVEHRLQMDHNLQTHTIPVDTKSRERLAALMGFKSAKEFEVARELHARDVRRVYDNLLKGSAPRRKRTLPDRFAGAEAEWKAIFSDHGFRDGATALRLAQTFVEGPGYGHVSERTRELAMRLFDKLLGICPHKVGQASSLPRSTKRLQRSILRTRSDDENGTGKMPVLLSDPDRVLARLDSFIAAYGTRALLYETWDANPSLFELLLLLFDRSEFLAEVAIRTPDLVDELVLSGHLRRRKTAREIFEDLQHGRKDEDQRLWIRRYHRSELMRIGLRDILGLADFEQNLAELTALADACLQYALAIVVNKLRTPPLVIVGLGKLGGAELNYGSDLDIIFVAGDEAKRGIAKLQRVAVEVMDLLSSSTEMGVAFATDARLRPDGEKGLLVNTLAAHEEYYRKRAQLWEIQALTRVRALAGDLKLGERFRAMAAVLTNFQTPSFPLAAYRPDWKKEIARMRERIEQERTPAGKGHLAIKTGAGGLMDAEFIAQTLCLAHGWQEGNTLRALERARDTKALDADLALQLIENYRQLRRIEAILRRWSFAGETLLPDDDAAMYRVAIRCGWSNAADFVNAINQYRRAMRKAYSKVLFTR